MIAAFAPLVEYFAPARAVLTNCFQVAAQSGVQHVEWGHEAVSEQREGLACLPERLRAIESSVAAVYNSVDQQREAGIDARLKTVEVFLANANPPLDTTSAQECLIAFENAFTAMHESLHQRGIPPGTVPLTEEEEKQDLMYAASLHQKARLKELDAVHGRLDFAHGLQYAGVGCGIVREVALHGDIARRVVRFVPGHG